MKTKIYRIQYLLICLTGFLPFSCIDNEPPVEDLPSADVAFTYEVTDDIYQLDYYVGATVEFTSISNLQGECTWDFGDGSGEITGNVVTHKFAVAGTYPVKLTVAGTKNKAQPILIKDIVPIMSIDPIEGGICEVLTTPVSISVELPNPEGLQEDYLWIFPEGATDENGNQVTTSTAVNPGKLKFSHVGSQAVRLQAKLGGRTLEEGKVNVPVAYNEEVPTLYYAVKGGNIMALKLVNNKPAAMNINPFDMAVSSGKHPLNILFNDASLYVLDCGQQFTFVDDGDGVLGDGRITVIAKDGSKVETMLTNVGGAAFNDPFYGYIEGTSLYFANRNTGIGKIVLTERNKIYSLSEYPWYVQNALVGYYNNGWSYGSMNACFTRIDGTWYWCKTYNGTGIFRFTEADILKQTITGGTPAPAAGVALSGMTPKSLVWDSKNQVIYFAVYDTGYEGLYRCTLDQFSAIGGSKSSLAPYKLKTADGKSVTPITEAGKGEGSSGEFIGICQLTLDEATGCVYFGLRSANPDEIKSGLMRYNPAKGIIEHVIEGVEVYGVAVNNSKSKLF
ncbi:MAG: PKD domain-containing protein [Dysgonamonadaceae bacterium]|jgi:PKD repeat protein|nr:PKD domain-containing protein [Dysgonamonadaceae bacterium]